MPSSARYMRDTGYTAMGVPMADAGPLPGYSESELAQNYLEDVERHGTEYANDQYAGAGIPRKYAGQARDIQHPDEPVQYELTETGERDAEVGAARGKARDLAERYGPDSPVTPNRLCEAYQEANQVTMGDPDAPEIGCREIAQDVARVQAGADWIPPEDYTPIGPEYEPEQWQKAPQSPTSRETNAENEAEHQRIERDANGPDPIEHEREAG